MEEKKNIGFLFDRIAKKYDLLNHLLSLNIDKAWRKKAIQRLRPCENLLDIATGTGDFALEIIRQRKADKVLGIDLSKQMLAIGKEKIAKAGKADIIALEQADVAALGFSDEVFDAVTCAFGVRNFADLDKGLSEMYRVLRHNGQIVILEFSYPRNCIIKFFYNIYFSFVLPLIGKLVSKDKKAYGYLPKSVKGFIQGEEFVDHLVGVGFQNPEYKYLSFGICTIYTAQKKQVPA